MRQSKSERTRLMRDTRRRLDLQGLYPIFELTADGADRVRCKRCGHVLRLNQQAAQRGHYCQHAVDDRTAAAVLPGGLWAVKIGGRHIRYIRIVAKTESGWRVRSKWGGPAWVIRNPGRFLWRQDG